MAAPRQPRSAIALIADIVGSRRLDQRERSALQGRLEKLLDTINREYRDSIGADFLITLGDEFQGVIVSAAVIPSVIWDIEAELRGIDIRIALGFGELNPPFKRIALGMDGPAFHRAREALELWPKRRNRGGVFLGFGDADPALNGFARVLRYVRERLTDRQFSTLSLLRKGRRQAEVAKRLGVSRQMISLRVRGAGLEAYTEAEDGWRSLLHRYDVAAQWGKR